jgi:hypothetical protein
VRAGLAAITDADVIVVHDAARPFASETLFGNLLRGTRRRRRRRRALDSKSSTPLSGSTPSHRSSSNSQSRRTRQCADPPGLSRHLTASGPRRRGRGHGRCRAARAAR